ncbi:alpha-2,3-sialyltransferase, partial [Campylobacter jejuni]|nr:alpha-2,3-sialyltransferase [Campylobacter jejuni]
KEFNAYFKFHEIYFNQRITSGVYMCTVAIALGYKEIYLSGIDFYDNGGGMLLIPNKKSFKIGS